MRAINKTIKKMQERVNVIDSKNIKIATGIVFTSATEPKDRPIINMLEAMLTELNLNTHIQKRPTLKLEG